MARKKSVDNKLAKERVKAKIAVEEDSGIPEWERRTTEWKDDEQVAGDVEEVYQSVVKAFEDKQDQNDTIKRCWDIYDCTLGENQSYNGDSQIFLGLVRDAIEARVTRFMGALFPTTARYSNVVSDDGTTPYETIAMCDHYVKKTDLRSSVIPSLIRNGDITGQYTVFVSWKKRRRYTVKKKQVPTLQDATGAAVPNVGTVGDIEIQKEDSDLPDVMVVDSRNMAILPTNVDNVEDADITALALWLTKSQVRDFIDDGTFDAAAGKKLLDNFGDSTNENQPKTEKEMANAAGVRQDSKGGKTALVYMIYTKLLIGGRRRRCLVYHGGADTVLSVKRNPLWSDRIPILTAPALKVPGTIWGASRVAPVEDAQYAANDAVNMAFDSAKYSLMPIVMSNPATNPRTGTMIITMGAMWEVDPASVKILEFPKLWMDALQMAQACGAQIEKSLGVNPAMIPQSAPNKKPSQAQVAQEQQVALESTADAVAIIEHAILDPLLEMFYEFDYQYRTEPVAVRQFGPMGVQAEMQQIPPAEVGKHYEFSWFGVEGAKNAQQIQQGISLLNVLAKIPAPMMNGRKLDAGPLVDQLALDTYGPTLASKIVIDQRHQLSLNPKLENEMLMENFAVPVQPNDNDVEHIISHKAAMHVTGDPAGLIRQHMMEHIMQLQKKQMHGGGPGPMPQGTQPPQVAGPRPGAQVQPPTGPQQPPGAIHPDNMRDPNAMPRPQR